MADIIRIKNAKGEDQYPITKPECIMDEHGMSLVDALADAFAEINESLNNIPIPQINHYTPLTYRDIVAMRDVGMLEAGTYYRITDYETTTAQENTRSAGHPFDVVVLALNNSTLAEEAYAVRSDRDTNGYFQRCNLSAWKLWYSLDNNTQRFAWADTENGKGVIYRMIDEWNNDIPYDFKNIQFARYGLNIPEYNEAFTPVQKAIYNMVKAEMETGNEAFVYAGLNEEGKIWENEEDGVVSTINAGRVAWCYTFNDIRANPTDGYDLTMGTYGPYENYMKLTHDRDMGRYVLPNNVFLLAESTRYNYFGELVVNNTFLWVQRTKMEQCNNVVAYDFTHTQLERVTHLASRRGTKTIKATQCSNVFLGVHCDSNEFKGGCAMIVLGDDSYANTFEKECYNVVVEEGTIHKTISLNSNGEVKIFNLADLADLLNNG